MNNHSINTLIEFFDGDYGIIFYSYGNSHCITWHNLAQNYPDGVTFTDIQVGEMVFVTDVFA